MVSSSTGLSNHLVLLSMTMSGSVLRSVCPRSSVGPSREAHLMASIGACPKRFPIPKPFYNISTLIRFQTNRKPMQPRRRELKQNGGTCTSNRIFVQRDRLSTSGFPNETFFRLCRLEALHRRTNKRQADHRLVSVQKSAAHSERTRSKRHGSRLAQKSRIVSYLFGV